MIKKKANRKCIITIVFLLIFIILVKKFWISSIYEINCKKDIELGEYNNLQIYQDDIVVTEQDLEEELKYRLRKYAQYKEANEGKVEKGNIVTLILSNSQQGSNECLEVCVGDKEVNQKIDDELIGMIKGEEKEISIDNVTYSLQILGIKMVVYPELDDKFVKKELGYDSVSEYIKYLKEEIYQIKLDMEIEDVKEELLNMVVDNSEIYGCTQKKVTKKYEELKASYETYAKLYHISYEDTLNQFETSEEKMLQHVIQSINQDIVVNAIMQSENVNLGRAEYRKRKMEYIEEFGYTDIEEFIEDCGEEYLESEVNKQIVQDILYEKAIIS